MCFYAEGVPDNQGAIIFARLIKQGGISPAPVWAIRLQPSAWIISLIQLSFGAIFQNKARSLIDRVVSKCLTYSNNQLLFAPLARCAFIASPASHRPRVCFSGRCSLRELLQFSELLFASFFFAKALPGLEPVRIWRIRFTASELLSVPFRIQEKLAGVTTAICCRADLSPLHGFRLCSLVYGLILLSCRSFFTEKKLRTLLSATFLMNQSVFYKVNKALWRRDLYHRSER